jgi:hypothetical protein
MRHVKRLLVLSLCLIALSPAAGRPAQAESLLLITPEEAALGAYQGVSLATRGLGGPVIKVLSPDQSDSDKVPVLGKPVHISVHFESFSGAKVDMSTLRVIYLKLFGIDITDRLKPYVTGDAIEVPAADIPDGDHSIRVDIKDTSGHESQQTFHFLVK